MPNLDTLNTLIAVVFVLLVLSMIVQSVQEVIKKLLKLKSRQIEESLVDLFENLLGQGEQASGKDQQAGAADLQPIAKIKNSKFLERARMPLRQLITHPATLASPPAKDMFDAVMNEFRDIGRTSASSKQMLDSISKEDLMKVLQRLGANRLLPNFTEQLNKSLDEFLSLKKALERAEAILPTLDGDAGAKFAKLRDLLAPLFNDLKGLLNGDDSLKPNVLLADALNLRNIKFSEAMDLLGEVQQQVDAALTAATDEARKTELKQAQAGLREAIQHLSALGEKLDAALAPLRAKVSEVENWFDTVMQSFEERYNRGMKTVAFVISLTVAFILNANIFSLYRDISSQPEKRIAILKASEEVKKRHEKPEQQNSQVPNAAPSPMPTFKEDLKNEMDKIDQDASLYTSFGFLSRQNEWGLLQQMEWGWLWRCFYMGLGWLLMAALLSVGAPFWNDTLQSLFGVKNLLQKKSDIKNVEQQAGAGQPKP